MSGPRGLDVEAVTPWLRANLPGAEGPLAFELIAAGGSNLTYRVEAEHGARWALRRPPVSARLASAHDVDREWRILEALHRHDTGVPVPEPVARCADTALIGAPFIVMGFAEGRILRGPEDAAGWDEAACEAATDSLIDVQVAMHSLDVEAVGLGDLGRPDGYVERQLKRWLRQFEASTRREVPLVHTLHEKLAERIPAGAPSGALAHGDYRFDNTVLGPDHRVHAVLDWELCTLGDPVADFVWSLQYWGEPEDDWDFGHVSPTRHPAFPRRQAVIERYATRSGFDLDALDYYTAFSWWKMACLLEGVAARLAAGAGGGANESSAEAITERVDAFLERAAAYASGL